MKKLATLIFAAVVLPVVGFGAAITLHNTGVNSSDVLVGAGAQASFWALVSEPAGASEAIGSNPFRYHHPAYFADTATAAWVAPTSSGNAGLGGLYTYQLTFDLTGLNPATALISGIFGTDNDGAISLNGQAPAASTSFAGFGTPTAFTFNSGFVAGLNTILVTEDNGGDPTAFFVQFNTASTSPIPTGVPEPGAAALFGVGLAALAAYAKRRK